VWGPPAGWLLSRAGCCCGLSGASKLNPEQCHTSGSQANVERVGELAGLVRGELSGLARRLLGALIPIDVHARDIVDQ